jgi:hypothetical protein
MNMTNGKNNGSGGTNFLSPDSIEQYNRTLWDKEIVQIIQLFDEYQYRLLSKEELEKTLTFKTKITTNFAEKHYTVFDCFFHWED